MHRSVLMPKLLVRLRTLTIPKKASGSTTIPASDTQTREASGQSPEEQLPTEAIGADTVAPSDLSQINPKPRPERISPTDQVKVLNECIRQSPTLFDPEIAPRKREGTFWAAVHGALGERLRDRYADSSQLRHGVARWVKRRRDQLGSGQQERPQDQRREIVELLDRWIRISGNEQCLINMDIIKICIWFPIRDCVKKLVSEWVHAELRDQLHRFENELRMEGSQNALTEEPHSRPNMTQRISNIALDWDGMDPHHLIRAEALLQLVEKFKPSIEKVVVNNMEDRLLKSSRVLRSNRQRSVFSPESLDTESEAESEPASGQTPSSTSDWSTNRESSADTPLQSVERTSPSPSRSPSPPIPSNQTSYRVYRPGVGWRTHYKRTRPHGPRESLETETDAMSHTQSRSPNQKRGAPHDEARDATELGARKKQKGYIEVLLPSSSHKGKQIMRRYQRVTEREHDRELGQSADSPIVIDHLSDVESCSLGDVATSDQASDRPEKHKKHPGKDSKRGQEPTPRLEGERHKKRNESRMQDLSKDGIAEIAPGRKTEHLGNKTPSDDMEMSSARKASHKKKEEKEKEEARRMQLDDDESASDLSASHEQGAKSRCVSLVSTATSEFPSIDELCARVSQKIKPGTGSGGNEYSRSRFSVRQCVADDPAPNQSPGGRLDNNLPRGGGEAIVPSHLTIAALCQRAWIRECESRAVSIRKRAQCGRQESAEGGVDSNSRKI